MAVDSQGTHLFVIDPDDGTVITVGCINALTLPAATRDQRDDTCLSDLARRFSAGLKTPGAPSFTLLFDHSEEDHQRLWELESDGVNAMWAVGFSGSNSVPTSDATSDGGYIFDFPNDRSFIAFEGYISGIPLDFQIAANVTSAVTIQQSGDYIVSWAQS